MRRSLLCILGYLSICMPCGAPAADAPAAATAPSTPGAALIGCWQGAKEPSMYVLFKADSLYLLQQGQLVQGTIAYQADAFDMGMMGQHALIHYTLNGGTLVLQVGGQQVEFKRIATTPAAIADALTLIVLGAAQPSAARVEAIKAELAKRMVADQAVRTDPSKSKDMGRVDSENTAYVRALVTELGWIDVGRFGFAASDAAFLIVQHSGSLPLMQAVLPEIEKDLKAKRLPDGQPYALLFDRTQMYLGKPQRYGSQIVSDAHQAMVLYQLEDPAHVDRRRAEIGMQPLAEYLKYYKDANGGKGVAIPSE